jgi:hypothetical protein
MINDIPLIDPDTPMLDINGKPLFSWQQTLTGKKIERTSFTFGERVFYLAYIPPFVKSIYLSYIELRIIILFFYFITEIHH